MTEIWQGEDDLQLTLWPTGSARGTRLRWSWDELCERLALPDAPPARPADARRWSPEAAGPSGPRSCGLLLTYDPSTANAEQLATWWGAYQSVWVNTFDTDGTPLLALLLATTRPLTEAERAALLRWAARRSGSPLVPPPFGQILCWPRKTPATDDALGSLFQTSPLFSGALTGRRLDPDAAREELAAFDREDADRSAAERRAAAAREARAALDRSAPRLGSLPTKAWLAARAGPPVVPFAGGLPGLWPGLHLLTGPISSGRRQLALQLASGASRSGAPILLISELSGEELAARFAAILHQVPWSPGRLGAPPPPGLEAALDTLTDLPVWGTADGGAAAAFVDQLDADGPVPVVVIDRSPAPELRTLRALGRRAVVLVIRAGDPGDLTIADRDAADTVLSLSIDRGVPGGRALEISRRGSHAQSLSTDLMTNGTWFGPRKG